MSLELLFRILKLLCLSRVCTYMHAKAQSYLCCCVYCISVCIKPKKIPLLCRRHTDCSKCYTRASEIYHKANTATGDFTLSSVFRLLSVQISVLLLFSSYQLSLLISANTVTVWTTLTRITFSLV